MERGDSIIIYPIDRKFPSKLKKQRSRTLPLENKKNSYVAFKGQQSSDKEELDYETEDYSIAKMFQQSSDEAQLDCDTKDSSIDHTKRDSLDCALGCGMASSSKPEQTRSKNVRNGGSGLTLTPYLPDDRTDSLHRALGRGMASSSKPERTSGKNVRNDGSGLTFTPYFPDDSTDSLHHALGHDMASSSKPERTRSKNVRNGGSGLTPCFPDDSNRRSTIIARTNVNIVNKYSYLSTINQGGHTFIQNGGCRDCRQYQAVNVRGGRVTQGNVPVTGGGAAKYGR